ncbi:MAG: hypothetical protein ACI8QZ_004342 [Chlamydiales bacterium]|jgi:hypothetical protein
MGTQRSRLSAALGQPSQVIQPSLPPPALQEALWTVAQPALPPGRIVPKLATGPPRSTVEKAIEAVPEAEAWPADEAAAQRKQIALLERRLAKLNGLLDTREEEVAQLRATKVEDTGLPSTYREIQGIALDDAQGEAKKEMMSLLFQANLKLHRGISSQTPSGD